MLVAPFEGGLKRMLKKTIKNLWSSRSGTAPTFPLDNLSPDLQKATTVLLLEVTRADLRVIHTELKEVEAAIEYAEKAPLPDPESVASGVYAP